jgi:uncharacterized protein (DUF983 family)
MALIGDPRPSFFTLSFVGVPVVREPVFCAVVNARGDSWVKILYFVPFFWTINPTQPLLH